MPTDKKLWYRADEEWLEARGAHVIADEGVVLTRRRYLDFVGADVTATDDSATDRTIVTVGSAVDSDYPDAILALSAGAYYKLNETTGNWIDSSGSGRDLTHTVGTGEVRGVAGGIDEGDGTLAVHVETAQQSFGAFDGVGERSDAYFYSSTSFSVSCWARATSASFAGVFSKGLIGTDLVNGWRLMNRNPQNLDYWGWCFHRGTASTATIAAINKPLVVGEWVHLVGTVDATVQRLYVNGRLVSEVPINPATSLAGGIFRVGAVSLPEGFGGSYGGFNGDIDSVAFWNYTLTPEQVALIATAELGVLVSTTTVATTVPSGVDVLLANGTFTVTLPSAVGAISRRITIKNIGTGTITVGRTSSQTIDGAASNLTMATSKSSRTFLSDGTGWQIISTYL